MIAPTLKLVGNSLLLGMLEVFSESFTLAEKSGIDSKDVVNIIKGMFRHRNPRQLSHDFSRISPC
jgi:3-hydroxyisobutyrate dehydrogenase-like beta-hydroxyacid dehydrogenase